MEAIKEHTRQLHNERLSRQKMGHSNKFGHSHRFNQGDKQISNMSSIHSSNMDSFINNARMQGHNANVGKGVWSLSSRPTERPYQRNLADTYPRNEYTMMPMQRNAPRYYDGKFLTLDHKDMVQVSSGDSFDNRPVVFKPQAIERVQTKKKYGMNLKGESAVPLHLCDDVTSELFQRSLDPDYKAGNQYQPRTGREAEIAELRSIISRYPDTYLPAKNQHQTSTLHPLNFGNTTKRWVEETYHKDRSNGSSATRTFGDESESAVSSAGYIRKGRDLTSGSVRSAPEWYSEFFPRQKVADALKFMGSPQHHKTKSKEFVLDFNTK